MRHVFSNRLRDRVKLMGWVRNEFWLLRKRLEKDRFTFRASHRRRAARDRQRARADEPGHPITNASVGRFMALSPADRRPWHAALMGLTNGKDKGRILNSAIWWLNSLQTQSKAPLLRT